MPRSSESLVRVTPVTIGPIIRAHMRRICGLNLSWRSCHKRVLHR